MKGGKESFRMNRGVRQGSIEAPLLLELSLQVVLEESFSPLEDQAI